MKIKFVQVNFRRCEKVFFFQNNFPFHKRAHPPQHIQRAPFLNLLWKLGKLKKFSLLSRHHFGIVLRHLHIKILFYCIARRCFLALNSLSRSGFFSHQQSSSFCRDKAKDSQDHTWVLIANVNVEHDTRKFLPRTWLSPFFLAPHFAVYLTFSHTHIWLDINKDDNVGCESKVNWSRHLRLPLSAVFHTHFFSLLLSPLWFIVRFTSMIFTPAEWLNIFLFTSSPDLKSRFTYNYERSSSQRGDDARLFVRSLKGRTQLTIINCKIYTSLVAASWLEGFEANEQVSLSSSSIQCPKLSPLTTSTPGFFLGHRWLLMFWCCRMDRRNRERETKRSSSFND